METVPSTSATPTKPQVLIKPNRVIQDDVKAWLEAVTTEEKVAAIKKYPQLRELYAEAGTFPKP